MNLFPIIGCGLAGMVMVFLLTPIILRVAQARGLGLNRGREFHHTHQGPVPRLGGLALAIAFVALEVVIAVFFPQQRAQIAGRSTVIMSSLAMFGIGFWDDLRPLGARRKLEGQVLVALCVHYAGLGIEAFKVPFTGEVVALHGWGVVLTVVWLVGITNLINLIDGVDGLAGGIGLMLMALLVYVGHENGTFVFLTAGMTGAVLAFLFFNFPPARIYLGDGGAYLIGYQVAIFSLVGSHKGTVFAALIAPLFVLALPIVDMCLAILRRGLRGLPLMRPDRRHIHHRLLATGMSRRQVVIWLYGLTLLFLVMGFGAFWSRGDLVPVLLGAAVVVLLVCAGRLGFTREWFAVGRTVGNSLAMRQEIQYARALTTWLRHEGDRCGSLGELFDDLTSASRRLGFTSVKLILKDGERGWSEPVQCEQTLHYRQELHGGQRGVLELRAPACMRGYACDGMERREDMMRRDCKTVYDARRFEIMSELLAESWLNASARYAGDLERPLRFDAPPPAVGGTARRVRLSVPPSGRAKGKTLTGDGSS